MEIIRKRVKTFGRQGICSDSPLKFKEIAKNLFLETKNVPVMYE